MSSGLPLLPIYLVEFWGSCLMIALSLAAFRYARRLVRLEPKRVIWAYLFWLCMALVALAVSRGFAHIVRLFLLFFNQPEMWRRLAPYSGGLNSITFVAVAVLTFYYENMRAVTDRVRQDARTLARTNRELEEAQGKLRHLNLNLEQRVEERTRELALSEQKFRHLFEGTKDLIFFCDENTRLTDLNASGVALLGYDRKEEVVGRPLAAFFRDEEKWARFHCRLSAQGEVADFEADWQRRDGSPLYLILTASAIRDERGAFQGSEGIAKDLTHFRQVTEQLIHSEKMASVGQLAAGVAHEINTPLGVILGYSQLLAEDFAEGEVRETLAIIEKQTKVCKRIVSDLLKFSRNTVAGEKRAADLNGTVEEALTMVEHTLNLDHIYLQRAFSPEVPLVSFDAERLRQVLVNILTNAHHAVGTEGIIGVWTRFNGHCGEAEIVIGDTGPGIPSEVIGRIFDPFFTTKGVGKGTGLGLSVSFGIVREHGGRIEAFSPPRDPKVLAAGMQTAFHITLPVEPAGGEG
ncbi:MAG: ATP-binding protein [Desulfobacteraceae bacterium]|nr:ATP-binding protein [Desulfobacteraceae bacterium]